MPASPTEPVIRARNLHRAYGANHVLVDVSVDIPHGLCGLLGPNGAGKTTLFGLVLGLHEADSGHLEVLGVDPATAGPALRERIGYAPEHHRLPPDMQALDLVRHLAEAHGLPPREAMSRATDALWQVGLGEERLRPVGTMSTGQRQRVKLAAALAHDPALLLLDEPTDGLDPGQRDAMLALIRRIGTEYGIDVVLSSHLLDEVERVCDHVVILAGGRILASGDLGELRRHHSGVIVEVDDGAEALEAALRQRGLHPTRLGRTLTIVVPPELEGAAFDAVRDDAAALAAPIRRLLPRRASLEEVFLEVTR